MAIAAMVCGIAQFFGFWLLGTIPAIVLGHIARRQIRQTGEQGDGMALAGLILGYVGLGLSVIAVTLLVVLVAAATHTQRQHPRSTRLLGRRKPRRQAGGRSRSRPGSVQALRSPPWSAVSAATKASCGTSTRPMVFIRFLPSFCFSSSFRFLVMSPP